MQDRGLVSDSKDNSVDATARLRAGVDKRGERAEVELEGELDLATVGIVEEAISDIEDEVGTLVLDLRKLTFLDSSGLRLILTTVEGAEEANRRVFVVKGPAQVERVLELTGAAERLNLIDDPSLIDQA